MTEDEQQLPQMDEPGETAGGVGARLRAERERRGLSLEDVADHTKIAERHLTSIENEDFAALPGRTYAVGFVRNVARMLELDEEEIVEAVRAQMNLSQPRQTRRTFDNLEAGDPGRVPSAKLAWGVGALLIVLLVVGFVFARNWFMPAAELPPVEANRPVEAAGDRARAGTDEAEQEPSGQVVFTATADRVWVKFYDASGRQLMQKEMARGETYAVPADAERPQLWTGRPDALTITIGGQQIPPLSQDERVVRDVPVDAQSLNARPPGPGLPDAG